MQPEPISAKKTSASTSPDNNPLENNEVQMFYTKILKKWINQADHYYKLKQEMEMGQMSIEVELQSFPFNIGFYHKFFLQNVYDHFRISVVFDNAAALAILNLTNNHEFIRFSSSQSYETVLNGPFYNLTCVKPGQKWIILYKITQILYSNKYISKNKFQQIKQIYGYENSVEKKITSYCKNVKNSKNKNKNKNITNKDQAMNQQYQYHISKSKFKEKIGIQCKLFWTKYLHSIREIVSDSKCLKQLYKIFHQYLQQRLSQQQIRQIQKILNIQNDDAIFVQLAQRTSIFNNLDKLNKIELQVQQVKAVIKNSLMFKYIDKKIAKLTDVQFQNYGSFRSKICLLDSDVDVCVFARDQQGAHSTDRFFVDKCLWNVYNTMKGIRAGENQLKIEALQALIFDTIKVPFIRIKFDSTMPMNSMDIVINNIHGVQNSKMLEVYSQNKLFLHLALLLKKWGKKRQLISQKRLSSYGISLMLLYLLMTLGYLDFLQDQQLKNFSFNTKFKGIAPSYIDVLYSFFCFYSQQSDFHQNKRVICLVKNCDDHKQLIQPNFLINIHDPFGGPHPNPGRIKIYDRQLFFNSFKAAKMKINVAKKMNKQHRKKLLQIFFGFSQDFQNPILII